MRHNVNLKVARKACPIVLVAKGVETFELFTCADWWPIISANSFLSCHVSQVEPGHSFASLPFAVQSNSVIMNRLAHYK